MHRVLQTHLTCTIITQYVFYLLTSALTVTCRKVLASRQTSCLWTLSLSDIPPSLSLSLHHVPNLCRASTYRYLHQHQHWKDGIDYIFLQSFHNKHFDFTIHSLWFYRHTCCNLATQAVLRHTGCDVTTRVMILQHKRCDLTRYMLRSYNIYPAILWQTDCDLTTYVVMLRQTVIFRHTRCCFTIQYCDLTKHTLWSCDIWAMVLQLTVILRHLLWSCAKRDVILRHIALNVKYWLMKKWGILLCCFVSWEHKRWIRLLCCVVSWEHKGWNILLCS